jgi:hypothetical protein
MYHALLSYVYEIEEIKDAANLPTKKYYQKLNPLYNLSFLDEKRKCDKVISNFNRINADVFFFQEYA